ncbi:hypothetical protein A3K29_05440 [Candidatus Collierbacteria bacterium RIFOXYB2_FULL_46_14]|nr:MAG: hypothetical protein A3K29_05440 [Candidatus Collierbacteria bacterium RIFOXYB2_FULL_46_14]OGD76577.1 MAG: hypothetical protein A3K43_05440 [Candidatus Collierbacteria bacterium RIFOXYA2_FULL_46_20]OGD77913.1 MAG: hypothetical protein A3K39_05440 [Candidatus Collierbacteria bacterium RIFOXYC2_FULL_43_15]OGD81204.1 MAG: hypothetical protein A2320_05940 [Pseudomonadales bacterium GWC2_63_15]OGD82635.1 MAG: hypothetical protein A3K36_05440 [Candidatus Collierbacteria bacterium RIFOXYD2_FUL
MKLSNVKKWFTGRKSVEPPVPAPRIVNPWPDGAEEVNVFVVMPTEDLPRGRYTFVRQAFVRGQDAKYGIYGIKGSWRESGLKEAVLEGKIAILPSSNRPSVVTVN